MSKPVSHDCVGLSPNRFKAALLAGRQQLGLWSSLCSAIAAEIIAGSGFDWILIDTEHAPNEIPGLLSQLHAMTNGTAEPVVRCAWNDPVMIKRILDIGARSLLVPFVQNAEEAQRAVAATRYPPLGIRGVSVTPRANLYGRVPGYHRSAHEQICVLVQVETAAALREIERIASVEGVDGIFVGPSDLAADLGHLGNPHHAEVQAAIESAATRIQAAGKAAGILTSDPDAAARYIDIGFAFIAVGSDVGVLARGTEALASQHNKALQGRKGRVVEHRDGVDSHSGAVGWSLPDQSD